MPNKYFEEIVRQNDALQTKLIKEKIVAVKEVLAFISESLNLSRLITHIEDREDLVDTLRWWKSYLCSVDYHDEIDININAPGIEPERLTKRLDEFPFELSPEDALNRVNAWQAHPFTTHALCPSDQTLLVFQSVEPGPQYKLHCLKCGHIQEVPPYMVKHEPGRLRVVAKTIKCLTDNPEIIDEIRRRLEEDEIID